MSDIERRQLNEGLELRAKGETGGRTLVGYAAVFDSKSEVIRERGITFREVIRPGAFDRALKEDHDVRALVNHESGQILGRTKSGTLRLSVDEKGLRYEVDLPDTTVGRDLSESIKRGDITGSSFGFRTIADEWPKESRVDGMATREILDLELLDVSPVTYPAYQATQVSLRALERAKAEAIVAPPEAPPEPEAPVERLKREKAHLDRL